MENLDKIMIRKGFKIWNPTKPLKVEYKRIYLKKGYKIIILPHEVKYVLPNGIKICRLAGCETSVMRFLEEENII